MTERFLWEILVPCKREGRPVTRRHHKEWDKVVRKVSQGLTLMGIAKGQWIHTDTHEVVAERVIPVRFHATVKQAKKIADFTIGHYSQHTVMLYAISDRVLFVERK